MHLFILASYGVVSAAAGFVLSQSVSQLAPTTCYLIAGAGFLAAALLHEIFSRRLEQRDLANQLDVAFDEVDELRDINRDLMADVVRAREEIAVLCDVVESAADDANQMLAREMKVLQSQLGHLESVRRPKAARPSRRKPSNKALQERQVANQAQESKVEADADTDAVAEADAPYVLTNVASPQSYEGPVDEAEILGHIREALESNRVDLYIQPIVSLPQRRAQHFEAFSRIRTADGRIVAARQYLDVAKKQGLIGTIDNLLLMRCVQLLRRNEKRQSDVSFFVNISDHTLNDTEFLDQFIGFMASNPTLATRLVFEIAQRDVMGLSDTVLEQLAALGKLGFRFSMDQVEDLDIDFQALAQANFRFMKVPISLLLTLPEDGANWVHPRNLKAKSTVSEISLVVERIEQESDVIEVLEYGFDFGQGFLFGAPRPSRDEADAA
jgi:cyclic-di-GMP phosphodiesterase TipF (flagellum assembly factor)